MNSKRSDLFPCACCGFLVFDEPPGSYAICPVCGWEDDHVQLRYPRSGGANAPLIVCQRDFLEKLTPEENRAVCEQWLRCPDWRPLSPEDISPDGPQTGLDYFGAALEDAPEYYWRRSRAETGCTPTAHTSNPTPTFVPNREQAVVDRAKVTEYLLNPSHPDGAPKARFFASFGFVRTDPEPFVAAVRTHVRDHPATELTATSFGTMYTVNAPLVCPDNRAPEVRTVWIIEPAAGIPRLVTAYPVPDRSTP